MEGFGSELSSFNALITGVLSIVVYLVRGKLKRLDTTMDRVETLWFDYLKRENIKPKGRAGVD